MRKKIFVFLSVISMCLFGLFNSFNLVVHASSNVAFDEMISLEYYDYEFVQEHEKTMEYNVIYRLPFRLSEQEKGSIGRKDYFLVHDKSLGFTRGIYTTVTSRVYYKLTEIIVTDETYFHFVFVVGKDALNTYFSEGIASFFESGSKMYIKFDYNNPNDVMKNFLYAEPIYVDGPVEGFGDVYHRYVDADVFLPDGTTGKLSIMPDYIDGYYGQKPNLFAGYDYVIIYFNLSVRSIFWSPVIGSISYYIYGLSHIVYDLRSETTTFYDYKGSVVLQRDGLIYITAPQFYIPETEAIDYQLRAEYEYGKIDGINIGRKQGYEEARKEFEEEIAKAYNEGYRRGRNEADFENLDMFGYLQALFGEQGLGRLLRLELLPGVSLGAVIMIPLAFWLVSFIMRWFN